MHVELLEPAQTPAVKPRWSAWFAIVALVLGNPLLHKSISDVCDALRVRWGFASYDRVALVAIPLASIAAVVPLMAWNRTHLRRSSTMVSLAALGILTAAAHQWLLVANIELIHFPQFALLASLLLAAGLTGPSAFLAATASGVLDETYQHLVIYAGVAGTYFDVNDIVLNAIGAAWGVVIFGKTLHRPGETAGQSDSRWRLTWSQGGLVYAVALAVLWRLDPPGWPLLKATGAGHPFYRVLSAPEGLIACLLLWGLVTPCWRACSTAHHRSVGQAIAHAARSAWWLLLFLVSGCATVPRAGTMVPASFAVSPFITTFWCGPPLAEFDDVRAAEIAAAGFTIVGPPCEGDVSPTANRRALDVAARHGLKLWVADSRFDERARSRAGWEAAIDAAVSEYRGHPAFGGYFVADEPSADQFEALGAVVTRLRAADPANPAYINLNPDYVFTGLPAGTYRQYVERFVSTVQPPLVSYDYYPFRTDGDRSTFFSSLTLMREVGQRDHRPFMLIVLAMPHGRYRDPTEGELSWQVLHALAYGARGVSYFAYWTPVNVAYADVLQFRHGLIEDGRPTSHYFDAMRLNHTVRAIAAQLVSFDSIGVRDSEGTIAAPPPFGPVTSITGGAVTAGMFGDQSGQLAVLLVNRDYRRSATVALHLRPDAPAPLQFDATTGRWHKSDARPVTLPAGGAQLLRWPAE